MPIKIGSKKIKKMEKVEKKKYTFFELPVSLSPSTSPLAPPPSPSYDLLSGPNVPALLCAGHPIEKKGKREIKRNSSKRNQNMRDGAIVHLKEDGTK